MKSPLRATTVLGLSLGWLACVTTTPPPKARVSTPPSASVAKIEALPAPSLEPSASSSAQPPDDDDEGNAVIGAPSASAAPVGSAVCNPQQAFEWLERKSYVPVSQRKKEHEKALRFRTEQYGFVKGFGDPGWNAKKARDEAVATTVFGLPTTVNKKIVPALKCVEAEIKASCGAFPYTPKSLSGLRDKNTYRAGEVTNHLYGIALDIDPLLNSCCGCVKQWAKSPLCKKKAKTIWERMSMPKCWVDAFEKYGFYWLGHDKLQDTMHFEFLADPDRIMVSPSTNKAIAVKAVASSSATPQ